MRPALALAALLALWAPSAWAQCAGAFLQSSLIENCLDQPSPPPPPPSGVSRSWGRNLAVTRPDQPPQAEATVNLWVSFAFDSAELSTDARITLDELAKALRGPRLGEKRFVLAGHTDAVGSAEYNQSLSERRANAVRDYLVTAGQVTGERLAAEGLGFSRPLNAQDPRAAENRRVEVRVNP
jgi:outer membrane protein OmpA-like peptidoglycan-associated protein